MLKDEKNDYQNPLFKKLNVDIKDVKIKPRRRIKGSAYELAMQEFILSIDEDKRAVQYLGDSKKLAGVVATLRKIAIAKKYPVKTEIGLLPDGMQVIVFSKDKVPEHHPRSERSKSKK